MGKPVLFVIDDEPEYQQAFERDLLMKYADTFQVLQAHSGELALEILKELRNFATKLSGSVSCRSAHARYERCRVLRTGATSVPGMQNAS